jgi:hypothetical protein
MNINQSFINKIHLETKFILFMKNRNISKRKEKENRQLCNEFPSFLYDMINDKIDDIFIYEFIFINYKRESFLKQLYYRDPMKTYWDSPLSLAIYKEKITVCITDRGPNIVAAVELVDFPICK